MTRLQHAGDCTLHGPARARHEFQLHNNLGVFPFSASVVTFSKQEIHIFGKIKNGLPVIHEDRMQMNQNAKRKNIGLQFWAKDMGSGISQIPKGLAPNQEQPMTPAFLRQLYSKLDLATSLDASFWAICLVEFYGMFRTSHLLPTAPHLFDPVNS